MKFYLLVCAGVIIVPTSLATKSETPSETCRLERSGKATGPSADICQHIGRRWTMLMGTSPIPGVIRVVDRDGYRGTATDESWVLESPLPERNGRDSAYRSSDGLLRYYAENIVPHEAGHHVFGVYTGRLRVWVSPNQYGTQMPDWLDEAAAIWMESAAMRRKRVSAIRNSTPLLERLVTLEHPNTDLVNSNAGGFRISTRTVVPPCAKCTWLPDSLRKKYQVTDSGTDASGREKTVIWYSDQTPAKSATFEEREFYPLAYSLIRFIRIRGGAGAVRELISRYQINPRPRIEVLSTLPGMPASAHAFEKAWHAFLASLPAEDE